MSGENLSTLILLGSFLVMVFLRFPIAYSVGISTVLCLLSMGQNLTVLPMQMVKGVWSFALMAVPFFITMGVLMGSGGISDKLIALAKVGMKEEDVKFTKQHLDKDDGRTVYEIEFVVNGMEYEFDIDAATGAILEFDADLKD